MPSLTIVSPEELHGGAAVQRAVLYLRLAGEVVRGVDGRHHAVHGEEGGQVGGVAGDQDQGEEPPDPACSSRCINWELLWKCLIYFPRFFVSVSSSV